MLRCFVNKSGELDNFQTEYQTEAAGRRHLIKCWKATGTSLFYWMKIFSLGFYINSCVSAESLQDLQ